MTPTEGPILITVPKYVTIPAMTKPLISKEIPIYSDCSTSSQTSSLEEELLIVRGKKKRLDHLTWEEKLQRKKLKNRVAAQTSRDRKKARMDEMEQTIDSLTEENAQLRIKFDNLFAEKNDLVKTTNRLEKQIEELQKRLDEVSKSDHQLSSCINNNVDQNSNIKGSAVSTGPLPQGMEFQSTINNNNNNYNCLETTASLWKIIALCLLCKISLTDLTQHNWKNLPKVYSQMSQQDWKIVLQEAANHLPKMKAPQKECLNQWWGPHQNNWNPVELTTVEI